MRRLVNNIISVICSLIRFCLIKLINGDKFNFDLVERFSPNVVTEFNKGSNVHLGKKVRVHSGSKIKVRTGAKLYIGDNVKLNYNCIITCHADISIGEGTELGPSVYLYDHDHDYKAGMKKNKYIESPISIGKNCWIGANTVILRGTTIGDNCVIGAGCVLHGKYDSDCVIIQKRLNSIKNI